MAGTSTDNANNPEDLFINHVLSMDSAGINACFEALMLDRLRQERPDFLDETRFFTGIGCAGVNALILAQTQIRSAAAAGKGLAIGQEGIDLCLEFWKNEDLWASLCRPLDPALSGQSPDGVDMAGPLRPVLEKYLKPWTLRTLLSDGVFVVIVAYETNLQRGGAIEPRIYTNLPDASGAASPDLDLSLVNVAQRALSTPMVQVLDQWAAASGMAPPNPTVLALAEAEKLTRFDGKTQEKQIGRRFSRVQNRVLSLGGGKVDPTPWNDAGLAAAWGSGGNMGAASQTSGADPAGPSSGPGCDPADGPFGTGGNPFGTGGNPTGTGADPFGTGGNPFGTGGGWQNLLATLLGAAGNWAGNCGKTGTGEQGDESASPAWPGAGLGNLLGGSTTFASGPTPEGQEAFPGANFLKGLGQGVNRAAYQLLSLVSKWSLCFPPPANSAVELTERQAMGFLGDHYVRLDPAALEIAPYFATLAVSLNPTFVSTLIEGLGCDAQKEVVSEAVFRVVADLSAQ